MIMTMVSLIRGARMWSSVAEWLECWTQVNFTRARGPGFDSWSDRSKLPGLRTVTWAPVQRVNQEKHD